MRKFIKRILCNHDWSQWDSREVSASGLFTHIATKYLDHFIRRNKHCFRCGKIVSEIYFVPALSISSNNEDYSGGVSRAMKEKRDSFNWDQRKSKVIPE